MIYSIQSLQKGGKYLNSPSPKWVDNGVVEASCEEEAALKAILLTGQSVVRVIPTSVYE